MIVNAITKFNHGNGFKPSPATWYENLPYEDKKGLLDELDRLLQEYRAAMNSGEDETSDECELAFTFISLITDEDR